ncbi:hypothetical protein Riv7116_4594 [Rivularia sp. PCC 7116]|uniref:hypothetical protein n=1 Tax=Rivularia sp. PCC 7116 TaxID=373994 RepID=UPI00029F3048|nr:hypothetical protein [Rivularia sp. PCC 7116]AFY57013.1 hypothetical protein Riv7116_4594 [Rivularia sp. PCC 7116]
MYTCHKCEYTTTRDIAANQEVIILKISALGKASRKSSWTGCEASIGKDAPVGTGIKKEQRGDGIPILKVVVSEAFLKEVRRQAAWGG